MKVIKSLDNRETLWKGTTTEERFLNFVRSLMATGLQLMKYLLTPLAKNVLLLLGLTAAVSETDATIQNKILGSWTTLVF